MAGVFFKSGKLTFQMAKRVAVLTLFFKRRSMPLLEPEQTMRLDLEFFYG